VCGTTGAAPHWWVAWARVPRTASCGGMFPPRQAQMFRCTQSDAASTLSPRAPQWCVWGVYTGVMPLHLCRERVKIPSPTVKGLTIGAAHKKEAAHLLRPAAMWWASDGDDAAAISLASLLYVAPDRTRADVASSCTFANVRGGQKQAQLPPLAPLGRRPPPEHHRPPLHQNSAAARSSSATPRPLQPLSPFRMRLQTITRHGLGTILETRQNN
jgi:hypothetical protein